MSLIELPSVFLCELLGYLDWRTKLNVIRAIPEWSDALRSGTAWRFITNLTSVPDQSLAESSDPEELRDCIRCYGQYYQCCELVLEFEDVYMCNMDLTLLNLVLEHCASLRCLIIHFPHGLGFKILECLNVYRNLMNSIPVKCRRIADIRLHISDYDPVVERRGISELFHLDDAQGLVGKVTVLDFSYVPLRAQNLPRAEFLCYFTNLTSLRTDDHLLDYKIIVGLFKHSLEDLYVCCNSLTRDYSTNCSATDIDWLDVHERFPDKRVHYYYACAPLLPWSLKPNPLLRTLVLDSLFNCLNPVTLESVGKNFPNLRVFAQLSTEWTYNAYDDDALDPESSYSIRLMANCIKLDSFYTSLNVSSSDLLAMADSGQLTRIWVNRDEIFYNFDYVEDQPAYLNRRMSALLGDGYRAMEKEEFEKETRFLINLDGGRKD